MTPIRAKRNSKAPERFSSDEIKNDSVSNGSNLSLSDKSGSITKIKLKPITREPLKVKLPRLKRLQPMQFHGQVKESKKTNNNNNNSNNNNNIGSFTSKIKLPQRKKLNLSARQVDEPTTQLVPPPPNSQLNGLEHSSDEQRESNINSYSNRTSDLNLSQSSKSDDDDVSLNEDEPTISKLNNESMAETDKSYDEVDAIFSSSASDERGMEIVVERNLEPTNSSGIRCPCGVDDDLGVMLECEKCLTWQHGHCVNVGPVEDAYENYVCAYCTLPEGKHHESLLNLVVNDKFQSKFEMLEEMVKLKSEPTGLADENGINFSTEELEIATMDLNRVANSLRTKWRILTAEDYNAELKIWQNPIWSEDPQENRKQQQLQTVRFVGDIYKSNLKLNICNMLNKMHKRCQLTRYQISCLEKQGQDAQSRLDKILASLDEISRSVEEFSDSLKQN